MPWVAPPLISWLLLPPSIAGPTLILEVAGLAIILVSFTIVEENYGSQAALYTSAVLSFHPLFIYHSSVGYGPEITSLLFLVGGIALIIDKSNQVVVRYTIAGIFFAIG